MLQAGGNQASRVSKKIVTEILGLIHQGRHLDLEARARALLAKWGRDAFLLKALSVSLIHQSRHADALEVLDSALGLVPRDPELHSNRGIVLVGLGRFRSAVESFAIAVKLNPGDAELHANYGAALIRVKQYAKATEALLEAIRLHPGDYAYPVASLGSVLQLVHRYGEAYVCYQQLALHDAGDAAILAEKIFCGLRLCEWSEYDQDLSALLRFIDESARFVSNPFMFCGMPEVERGVLLTITERTALAAISLANDVPVIFPVSRPAAVAAPNQRLKVGYMSADFREHAVSHLLVGVIEKHDRVEIDFFGYSFGQNDQSVLRKRLEAAFGVFRDLSGLSHDDGAEVIRRDGIDVLIDLSGWTLDGRPEILALRPAPVQATWLGYPGTLGHPILADYLIGDPFVSPLDEADTFAETLALLPHCYLPNDDTRRIGPRPSREEAGLPEKGFVFCSFNQSFKIQPRIFDVWCRLLQEVAGSVLWLANYPDATRERLRAEAEKRGVAGERLIFAAFCKDNADHLGRLQLADLALDTTPYNSHTTGCDALWAGVPLVAVRGETFAASVSTSLLHAVGLAELVAGDLEGYFSLARDLALSPDRLVATRERLARNRENAPLFDTKRFARDLETLYREMWAQHCTGRREPIVIAPRTWEAAHG